MKQPAFTHGVFLGIVIGLVLTVAFFEIKYLAESPGDSRRMQAHARVRLSFEVFGKVQGVFFRKHTKATAESLGLTGWVLNTEQGTVRGEAEGPPKAVEELKYWLQNKGSPASRIDSAVFAQLAATGEFTGFNVIRPRRVARKTAAAAPAAAAAPTRRRR